jgi:hypothetical protein
MSEPVRELIERSFLVLARLQAILDQLHDVHAWHQLR